MQRLPGALVRWKRRRNLAWPLLWMTTLLYLVGIGHFASNNTAALNEISVELSAMTVEFGPIVDYLVADGHDLVTPAAFVVEIEPVTAPISLELWYALLVGIVYLSVVAIVAHRIRFRRNTWGAITLDETIVVATALFVTSILVGGPLLAGSLLLPVIFGVVVHRTRRLPGWSPSYLYVCMVCGPIVGMIAGFVGYHTLLTDLLLFVVLPILGAIGLPLRVLVRRHVGI